MLMIPPAVQTPTVDVPLPISIVSSSTQSSSSTPFDVASPYAAFHVDAVANDLVDISPTIVARDVTTVVIIEANISEDVATRSSESTIIADVITSFDTY
ncbi:hypothetical protein GUJ93_ZPchr0008g12278 [Zizania palustris]|uniref:Uncharacterized protein n=1 Tax=Zizania palustris TaxID=103762 RepID=A0A8J5RPH0_ZIZPA|nr:hypothetical protein GUJ93_ZPchr0008g12278 [Zizania palustris]